MLLITVLLLYVLVVNLLLPRYVQGASGLYVAIVDPVLLGYWPPTYIFCLHFPTDFGGKTLLMLEGYNTSQTV